MRFDTGIFLLSLAALSNLPTGSGRVLYDNVPAVRDLVDPSYNATIVERAVGVPAPAPAKPAPVAPDPAKPEPAAPEPAKPEPVAPEPAAPEPAPAKPEPANPEPAKPDPNAPEDDPVPAGAENKAPNDDVPELTAGDQDEDLACSAKRDLDKRTGRSCGSRTRQRTDDERRTYYSSRGRRAEELVGRRLYDDIDYPTRVNSNYRMARQSSPEDSIEDFMPRTSYDSRYGFSSSPDRWQTYETYSSGNSLEPVSQVSYSRSSRPDGDRVAFVAHQRYAERDSNRYQLNSRGDNLRDADDNYISADGWQDRYVPVSQLAHEGASRSGYLDPPPSRYHFMSENVANEDGQRSIDDAFRDLDRVGSGRMLLRRDSTGLENTHYERISGIDNNYSYFNTAGRNRAYDNYDPEDIEVWEGPEYAMSQTWRRRD